MTVRTVLRQLVGEAGYQKLRLYRRRRAERRFAARRTAIQLRVGNFVLDAPSGHILARLQAVQPYRDLAIGIVAKELAHKYPGETFVDIGANIGDTAAIMATYAPNPKILVEPSPYYCGFLRQNAGRIPQIVEIHQVFISSHEREQGVLVHHGGTAEFESLAANDTFIDCKRLTDIADAQTRFIKIDTDGFDLRILATSLDFLARRRPCLYYENAVKDSETLAFSDQVLKDLMDIGYRYFAVFDDSGLHLISTTDLDTLLSLNRYLFKALSGLQERSLYNWDMLCLPEKDNDVFSAVTDYYRRN